MKICVIGLGSMGKRRIKLLKNGKADQKIVGIDHNPERVKHVASEYGISCFLSLSDLTEEMDCAFVCTSPQSHGVIIQECLKRGYHVFSEINLVDDLYQENIRLAGKKGKTLFLSSTPLYKEEMQSIDRLVKEKGEPCIYHYHVGQYLSDWHPWDNLKDFFASSKKTNGCRELLAIELPWIRNTFGEIERVHVVRRNTTKLAIDFPDTYLIQIEHTNGSAGNLTVDVVSRQAVRRLEAYHENLYIRWDGTPDSLYMKDIQSGQMKQVPAGIYIHEQGYGDFINEYAYAREIEAFFETIEGKQPLYSFEKDMELLKIIDEIEGIV